MSDPQYLDLAGCAELLGITKRAISKITRANGFPASAGTDGAPYWLDRDVLRWAAGQGLPLSIRVPLRFWPDARHPAEFLGAIRVPHRYCLDDVVLRWSTSAGTVGVVWRCDDPIQLALAELFDDIDADVLVGVDPDFGIDGPSVRSRNRALSAAAKSNRRTDDDPLSWTGLARVLGQPVPFWPLALRDPSLIVVWEPGTATVIAPARPDLDSTPLLRMAAMFDPGHPTHRTLINLVRVDQERSTHFAVQDLEIIAETTQRAKLPPEQILFLAARPLVVDDTDADPDELDPVTRRIGWLELLQREDILSMACVEQAIAWDHGRHFPFSSTIEVNPDSLHGQEWIARLEPAPVRTAQFVRLDLRDDDEALIDPLTDAPVVRRAGGRVRTVSPFRLPTTSGLAELVLDHPIWIRTTDGDLFPAPTHRGHDLDWGRRSGVLAVLLERLLTDITSEPADTGTGAPRGLQQLTRLRWPTGTILTREIIEAARDDRPYTHRDKPDDIETE